MKLPGISLNKTEIRDDMLHVKLCYGWCRLKDADFAENSLSSVIPVRLDKREKDEFFTLIP